MSERQKFCKKPSFPGSSQLMQNEEDTENTETLLLSGGKSARQLVLSHNDGSTTHSETDTTLPNLSDNNVARMRWLEGDSDEEPDYSYTDNNNTKHHQIYSEHVTPRFSRTRKMLPKICDSAKVRRNIFSDPQSLCNKIKMSCNITAFGANRRSSYSGIPGEGSAEETLISKTKPSIQGTGLLRKNRGEKAHLIDADDFLNSTNETPIQRSIEFRKPWSKTRIFIGRPQSGQPSPAHRSASESYGSMDMTCVGSKIRTDLAESSKINTENRAQKAARKFRNIRARSASFVEKTLQ